MQDLIVKSFVELAGLAALVATAILIYRQLRAQVAAGQASNFFTLVAYLQREEVRDAREAVHGLQDRPYDEWEHDAEATKAAQQVASSFDIAAVAMKHGLLDPRVFAEPWKTAITSTYDVLADYVHERQEVTGDPQYLAHYEWLAHSLKRGSMP